MPFARFNSRFSCSNALILVASSLDKPGLTPASISSRFTHDRSDSVPIPSCSATRFTVPWSVPNFARSWRTIRTARSFSGSEYRRVVGFPGDVSVPMTPSSFPRSGVMCPRFSGLGLLDSVMLLR